MTHDHIDDTELPDIDPDVMAEEAEQRERRLMALRGETTPKGIDDAIAAGCDPRPMTEAEEAEQLRRLRQVAGHVGRVRCEVSKDYDITRRNLEAALAEVGGDLLFEKDDVLLTRGRNHEMRELTAASLKGITARCLEYGFPKRDKDGAERWVPQSPPADVLEYLRDAPRDFPTVVKPLRRYVAAPVMLADGTITTEPGYYPGAAVYYAGRIKHGDLSMSLEEAVKILEEPFAEFPFVDESDRANALSVPLSNVGWDLFRGPAPVGVPVAPKEGTGKSKLIDVPFLLTTGATPKTINYTENSEEFDKRLLSVMLRAPQGIMVDNINHLFDSAKLCSIMTSSELTDRILGASRTVTLRNDAAWFANGNNIELTGELIRRSFLIRLNAEMEDPEERKFKIKDLDAWAADGKNQTRYVTSVLAILRYWRAAGSPRFTARKLGSFVDWSEVIGGVLEYIGHGAFLGNKDHFKSASDPDREMWRTFVGEWWRHYRHMEATTADLYRVVILDDPSKGIESTYNHRDDPLLPLGGGNLKSQTSKLGRLMQKKVGQVFRVWTDSREGLNLKIERAEGNLNRSRYFLKPILSGEGAGEPDLSCFSQ